MAYTEWKAEKNAFQEWVITDQKETLITSGLRHWNKDLILAAVNACIKVNPDHPELVAREIENVFDWLELALDTEEKSTKLRIRSALSRIRGEAKEG